MIFNKHSDLAGAHAFLSASKYHWINYTPDKLDATYVTAMAAQRGTELHALAHEAIRLGIKLQGRNTVARYVNDAIGFRMSSEVVLFYSPNAFGTADAISFKKNFLRIHDLKTGVTPASPKQLFVYAAFFCLEYGFKPAEIGMETRIYQNDDIQVFEPDPDEITHIMDKIITFDKRINDIRMEAAS